MKILMTTLLVLSSVVHATNFESASFQLNKCSGYCADSNSANTYGLDKDDAITSAALFCLLKGSTLKTVNCATTSYGAGLLHQRCLAGSGGETCTVNVSYVGGVGKFETFTGRSFSYDQAEKRAKDLCFQYGLQESASASYFCATTTYTSQ